MLKPLQTAVMHLLLIPVHVSAQTLYAVSVSHSVNRGLITAILESNEIDQCFFFSSSQKGYFVETPTVGSQGWCRGPNRLGIHTTDTPPEWGPRMST
ncbi:hypothetical protein C8R43DRAFT_121046 [Mycena crocata]|nr:hypothetical protein C8R43DRAFT_121046 [Mycena crocata]